MRFGIDYRYVQFYRKQSLEFIFEELFDEMVMKVLRIRTPYFMMPKYLPTIYIPLINYTKSNGKWTVSRSNRVY
jgi:hypothetical protein